jgi:hypothetical protein
LNRLIASESPTIPYAIAFNDKLKHAQNGVLKACERELKKDKKAATPNKWREKYPKREKGST